MRALTLVLVGLTAFSLCGCARTRLDASSTNQNWTVRDHQLLAITPYAQASIPEAYRRHLVDYHRKEAPGTIVVDTDNRYLYYVLPQGQAIRYGVTVGEGALAWSGIAEVSVYAGCGQRGCQPRKSGVGLAIFRITSAPGRTIRWGRGRSTFMKATRTRYTEFTALISRNISAMPSHQAASV